MSRKSSLVFQPLLPEERGRTMARARIALLIMASVVGASAALGASAGTAATSPATIVIKNFDFAPATLSVSSGATVRWENADVANHQVTSGAVDGNQPRPDGRVTSPLFFRGEAFVATFPGPGTYPYYCGVHPWMRGTIIVR